MEPHPVITAIDPLPADPNAHRVRVGRRTVGVLSTARKESLKLRVGQRWSPRLAARVEAALAVDDARRDALRRLGRTPLAVSTLRERQHRAGLDARAVEASIAELLADGWLDDRAFALLVAESALRRGPLGRDALAARLRRRGIDDELADEVASAACRAADGGSTAGRGGRSHASDARDEPDAVDAAESWAAASLRRAGRLPPARAARRVASGLARRGVDEDTIRLVLARLGLDVVL